MFDAPDIVVWNHGGSNTDLWWIMKYLFEGDDAAEDMALLAACDHIILSLGTFGWWAAWLGAGV